ncbi:MAG: tol-pal system protein YbgF, partial [Deltaproteobacteria bacterium]|nr:tol-pal system protein YbgF [Deltaproteobacteria bacterium]
DYLGFEISEKKNSGIKYKAAADEKLSEVQLYELAKQVFDKGDFENARKGFQKVLKRFPNSRNADNARFWIGETYYREKWYDKAILEYQKVIEEYPKGNKVSAALLKQGIAFYNLGEKTNAGLKAEIKYI